jgi:transposase
MNDEPLDALPAAVLAGLVRELRAAMVRAEARIAVLEAEVATLRGGGPPVKTATNSSLPPAKGWQTRRPEPPVGTVPAKRGPKPGHAGRSRRRSPPSRIDVVLPCRPTQCAGCGADLPAVGGAVRGRRQVTELPPIRPVVIEAQRLRVRCRRCGHGTVGCYPDGFGASGRFGPRLVATAALLHEEHHIAYARLVELYADLFGVAVSEGALVEAVGRLGRALEPAAALIAAEVRQAAVVGSDETGARVDGVTYWEWVFQTDTAAYHTIQRRRNTEVVLRFLDGVQPQVWVSDLWKPQLAAGATAYQICISHPLRDLEYARQAETGAARRLARAWARGMAGLLRAAVHLRNEQVAGRVATDRYPAEVAEIESVVDGMLALPLPAGWSADLQRRFQAHRRGLLTFLHDLRVPPTNNASERSLRPSVVHRKVTGGFRSEAFAQGYAALRTVADTARKRGHDLFARLRAAAGPPLPLATHHALAGP